MQSYSTANEWVTEVEPSNDSQGPIYRLAHYKDALVDPEFYGCTTLKTLFQHSVTKFGASKCLGWREGDSEYQWLTYDQVGKLSANAASALLDIGIQIRDRVGVMGANSPEWMVAMQACNAIGSACVPLYDTLGENAVEYIVNHAQCKAVFVHHLKIAQLAKCKGKLPSVKAIIYWGKATDEELTSLKDLGIDVFDYDDFLKKGEANPQAGEEPNPDDLCTIMYTSGTTGDPKGVMVKHSTMISEISGINKLLEDINVTIAPGDYFMSYLPLAHIFDRVVEETFLVKGGSIGYWRGNALQLLDDVAHLKPTFFAGVPRIFDRIYSKVNSAVSASFLKSFLFNTGIKRKWNQMVKGVPQDKAGALFNFLVFKKTKMALGGKVKIIISGGAPLAPHVEKFLRTAMCCPVVQGYGLTETMASTFCAVPDNIKHFGTVGIPFPSVEYRLEAVPDMNYSPFSDPPRGEVIIRGNSVFAGYFNDKEKTAEAIDKDGFFHTGDIGEITPDGGLKIIDRKKNIFKLSQGEYIAVEMLESTYKKNLFVEQIWVYGNSFESCVVAILVPSEAKVIAWAKEKGIDGDFASICAKPETKSMLLAEMVKTGRDAKLKGFEILKALHVDPVQFTVEADLITPTFKLKRPQLLKYYKDTVDALYAGLKKK